MESHNKTVKSANKKRWLDVAPPRLLRWRYMNKLTHTPSSRMMFWLISLIWFGVGLVFTVAYYSHMLAKGAYPYGADSIAIPIGNNFVGMLILLPFFLLLIFFATRNYVGGICFLVWNSERPYWSSTWTLITCIVIFIEISSLPHVWQWKLPTEFIKIAINLWFFLLIRAVLVSKSNKTQNGAPSGSDSLRSPIFAAL